MHHYYIVQDVVDEQVCAREAAIRHKQTNEKSWIHFHGAGATCTERCYLAPRPQAKEA